MQKWVRCQWRRCDDIDTVGLISDTGAVFMAEMDVTS